MKPSNKLDTIRWFIKRPQYLSHAFDILRFKIKKNREAERPEATKWAKEKSISKNSLYKKLNLDVEDIYADYPKEMAFGESRMAKCPIAMGGEGALNLLYNLVYQGKAGNAVETGVAYGWSSLAILLAMHTRSEGKLVSIDLPYIQKNNDPWVGCVIPPEHHARWLLKSGSDRMYLKKVLDTTNNITFVHYDSDKSFYGRKWAYPKLWDALSPGGFFVSDDIQDNFAFKEFCEALAMEPLIIEHLGKYVGILQKPESIHAN